MFEIRNYYFEPTLFEDYKVWAKNKALPFLEQELDLVGFWTTLPEPPQVTGVPMDNLGPANITWIIRWPDMATRDATFARVFGGEAWADIFKDVPGGLKSYLRMEARFTEALI